MGLLTDILGLEPTGWEVKSTSKLLTKGGVGVQIGGGTLTATFSTPRPVEISAPCLGVGLGAGGEFQLGREVVRSIVKYASVLKFLSAKTELYRYAVTNGSDPSIMGLSDDCILVLTTVGANAGLLGASIDYWAIYRANATNAPLWVWFSAGADVTGGGGSSTMQFRSSSVKVRIQRHGEWVSASEPPPGQHA